MVAPRAQPNAIEKVIERHRRGEMRQAETMMGITGKAQSEHTNARMLQTTRNQCPDAAWRIRRWDNPSKPGYLFDLAASVDLLKTGNSIKHS